MPQKIEATTYVDDPAITLAQLQIACEQAQLDTNGTIDELRNRLTHYLADFSDGDEIVCLNPEGPLRQRNRNL